MANAENYTLTDWHSDTTLAQSSSIDAFALNAGSNQRHLSTGIRDAFQAAQELDFKLKIESIIELLVELDRARYVHPSHHLLPIIIIFRGGNHWNCSSSFTGDARHFLGGLIHHPSESTEHYSILRHSHVVVFYRGPTTSVNVSIIADTLLPADRSLWLQCKGWSARTGMRAKSQSQHRYRDWS
ncbi:hypothetical protein BDV12DRAFT_193412 [Aspergillus spectabilis]